MRRLFQLPRPSLRFIQVWRRNLLVWRKLAVPSLLANLAEPSLYMLGLGYGLGGLIPPVDGRPYIGFLAAGTLCLSTMNSSTFESLYSAFSRMHVQKTWDAILNAPLSLDDIVTAEWVWAACKAMLSGLAILLIVSLLSLASFPSAWLAIPLIALIGLTFGAIGLVMTALAPNYDFFSYYFSLVITPMILISGIFFPTAQLPAALQALSAMLPLSHAVALARPILYGEFPANAVMHVAVLLVYAVAGFYLATVLIRRRLLP